ncbi:MAG: hypothetical protein R2764_08480 [Bacteroidales bacterium]
MIDWKIYSERDTSELIELIKRRGQDSHRNEALAAFHAFCFRFTSALTKESEIICNKNGLNKEDAVEIVQRTFKRFLKYCKNFDITKSSSTNPDTAVLLYLNKIARNVRVDYYNEKLGINISPYSGKEAIIYELPNEYKLIHSEKITNSPSHSDAVQKALSKLSNKHKAIYLTYSAYQFNGYKMPRKLLAEMREKLDLKQSTIQAYKKETVDKINEYLELYGLK